MTPIAIVNHSTSLSNDEVFSWVPALQHQIRNDFSPIWGPDALLYVDRNNVPLLPAKFWVLGVFETPDQPGALGYHDLTPGGQPVMKVFVSVSKSAGVSLSSVMSHELLETLVDPFLGSLAVNDHGNGTGTAYSMEVCDAVEADSYVFQGIELSNFVTPWWYGGGPNTSAKPAKYDFLGRLKAPFTMTPGGYFSFQQITKAGLQPWQQSFADERAKTLARLFSGIVSS
jgi:hypothetical protein